ncbi:hypothetical protein AB0939_23895 [Streptomyces sp. NPDC006990]
MPFALIRLANLLCVHTNHIVAREILDHRPAGALAAAEPEEERQA